ncbi:MAG: hypothetical protein ABUT20_58795 [Bacteroidota bacterium]
MKKLLLFLGIVAVSFTANAQKKEWKELKAFHGIMSSTFHPSEEGNLNPIKEKIADMVKLAKEWQKSEVPEGFNGEAVKPKLEELVKGTEELETIIKEKGTDKAITEKLSSLHDKFHEIVEKCRK